MDATKLKETTGYAQFTDNKTYKVSWTDTRGNWAPGSLANIEYNANINTAGFWAINRANTVLREG